MYRDSKPERTLGPLFLVYARSKPRLSSPQDIVTGEVQGSVEVTDSDAEPQDHVGEMHSPFC